jgi:hypothetical protein
VSVGALLIFGLMRVLRHARPEPELPTDEELQSARQILTTSRGTIGNLVLLRDKALLFGKENRAFLMYGVEGRSWVALGDPVGDQAEGEELAWRFREEADRHGGWTVFYEVGTRFLPLYIDLGLTLLKIGEEAVIDLDAWSLEGPSRRTLRRTLNDVRRRGVTFEMLPAQCVDGYVDELHAVSDNWLGGKAAREKGFSLGRFDPDYLSNFPLGVVRRDGKIEVRRERPTVGYCDCAVGKVAKQNAKGAAQTPEEKTSAPDVTTSKLEARIKAAPTYVLKDGSRIKAVQIIDSAGEVSIKDDAGKFHTIKKIDIKEIEPAPK